MTSATPWLRALAGGVTGTAVMTAALAAETRMVGRDGRLVDYDGTDHVVTAACRVLHRRVPRTARGRRTIFLQVHWGYGSAVALAYVPLRRRLPTGPGAAITFYAGCQAMAMTLFPTLGETPAPWRWPVRVLASSLTLHALYAATVAAVADGAFTDSSTIRNVGSGVQSEPGAEPC